MKMTKKTLKAVAMACIVGAAALVHGGDIISIDVLEDYPYSMSNGGKKYPNSDMPHSIGETVSIRIRLVNNDLGLRAQAYPWEFMSLSSSGSSWLMAPRLGLSVGGVPRYATMVSCLPTRVTTKESEKCFTDLVFEYTVRPGDLAQPLKLLNRDMREAVEGDEYLVVMPSANSHFYNVVDSSDSTDVQRDAVFSFCDETTRTQVIGHYPPADAAADERGTPTEDYTLAGAGVYIKTIDFDSDYVDTAADPYVWRTIAQGSSKSKKNGNPSIVVDAAADFEGSGSATMYVWSENDDIITPVGAKSVDGSSRKALPITISTGDTHKSFILKATGTEGQGAWIYMSSAPTNMYGTAGELIKNTVSRYVMIGEPEKPSVSVTFRGNSWTETTAKNGYMEADYPVEMAITLSETFDEDVTVTLTPVLDNDGTNIDVYANHVIATAPSAGLGNGWQLATNSVTFARNEEVEKFLYVYPLGATKGSARNGGTGIEFRITVEPATANAHFVTKTPGVLYVNPAAPNVIDPVSGQAYEFTAGKARDIAISVDDSCRNMRNLDGADEVVYAGTNYYSVVWERNDDTSTSTMEWKGLVPDSDGNLTLKSVKYPNSGTYLTSQITVTGPEGRKTVIPVSAVVSQPRTVTATPDRADLTYSEDDMVKLTIELSKRDGEDMYAFVEPLNEAATNCLSGGQVIGANGKASDPGVLVPGMGTAGFKTLDITLLDGYCEPKFQVVLCSEETYDRSKIVDRYTPVPVTIVCENAAPQGKPGKSMRVGGYAATNNAALPAPVPADNLISLRIDFKDVAADRRLPVQPNEKLIDWINGANPDEFTNGLFLVKWSFYNPNGMLVDTRITVGSAGTGYATTNFTFTAIGDNEVVVQMLDKDMIKALLDSGVNRSEIVSWEGGVPYGDENGYWETSLAEDDWGPEYRVVVPVSDKANVSVVPVNATVNADGTYGFNEGQTSGSFDIVLSTPAERPLTVKLWLERTARTEGATLDLPTLGSFMLKDRELAMDTNEFVTVDFKRGVDRMNVRITGMDGTPYSQYALHALVTTTTKNDNGVPLNEFYTEGAYDFGVFNKDPLLKSIKANVGISYNQSTGLASTNVVSLTKGQEVTIEWAASDYVRIDETNKFAVTWGSSEPGSTVTTNATRGSYSTKFSAAGDDKTITLSINDKDGGANSYEWHFKVEASKTLYTIPVRPRKPLSDAVASAYSASEGLGSGTITADGSDSGSTLIGEAWDYPVEKNTAIITAKGATGSFAYAFISETPDESSVFTPVLMKIDPQIGSNAVQQAVSLPLAEKDAIAYVDRYVEVVFSRSYLATDNLGDINRDGIPDLLASKVWPGAGRLLQLAAGGTGAGGGAMAIGSDMIQLTKFNYASEFLPGVWEVKGEPTLANNAKASYAPVGHAFTAFRKLRGFHEGLNYIDDQNGVVSEADFSEDEQKAYKAAFLATNGVEWTEADGFDLLFWSPEPRGRFGRMDPTLADTDGDGFPDAWEYFFWYQAKVWVPAGAGLGKPVEGQRNVFERFVIEDILRGTPIEPAEVEAHFDPCTPLEDMGDFDNDGLSDLEELVIGTNPCHWDTDGDLMCDGWEVLNALNPLGRCKTNNSDGDFMAFCFLDEYWGWQDPVTSNWVFDVASEIAFSDYILVAPGVIQLLNDVTFTGALVATPRVDGNGDPYCYGLPLAEEVTKGSNIKFWHWGYPMLDNLQPQSEVTLQAGEYLYNTDYVLVHDQVATAFGFDPRTGWNKDAHGYVASRWDPSINTALSGQDITGLAVNTEPYCDYDEYLALRYRRDYGVYLPGDADWKPDDVWGMMQGYTTAPSVIFAKTDLDAMLSGTNSTVSAEAATNLYATASVSETLANAFAEAGSDKANRHGHGADTDGDGIPDGWELYMSRCPNSGEFDIPEDYDFDGLETPAEFAGTDSCNAYIGCESIYRQHTGNASGWFNKFFPTNPYSRDTDGDGLSDADEGSAWRAAVPYGGASYVLDLSFIYGNPQDSITCCVRGGGLNPCTVDTDIDGLPDLWEVQYAGIPTDAGARKYVPPADGDDADVAYLPSTWIADGIYDGFAGSNVVYIVGGMDGTWGGDGWTDTVNKGNSYDGLIGAIRDVDFDHDGLQNFQEYLVQQVRHFRYDDITTPLMGRYIDEGEYDPLTPAADLKSGHAFHDAKAFVPMMQDADRFTAAAIANWGDGSSVTVVTNVTGYTVTTNEYSGVVYTNETYEIVSKVMPGGGVAANKHFGTGYNYMYSTPWTESGWRANGYMATPTHGWDRLITCALGYPYIMMPPAGAYVSTDPRIADTDSDGMDDYYEMFHGLNPLLGSTAAGASDIIATAWGQPTYFNAFWNEWTTRDAANKSDFNRYRALLGRPGSAVPALQDPTALDPIRFPWAMGANEADPDGDGLRNDAERVTANLTSPMTTHTDPTPLWFTDSGSPNSYVSQYYANTFPVSIMPFWPLAPVFNDPYSQPSVFGGYGGRGYLYAFEENEGYDTDNDWTADGREIVRTFRAPTDPLDFTDPARRQALYLDGNGSWVQTTASSLRPVDAVDMYKQFTVEAWVWPEETPGTRVIVDRSAEYGYDAITKDAGAIRSNFRIGITAEGRAYGMFDNDDSIVSGYQEGVSCQTVVGSELPLEEWSHVALTYDGKRLVLYVNGAENASAATHLIPANGVSAVMQDPAYTNTFEAVAYRALPCAFFIGGRPAAFAEYGADALEIATASATVMNQNEWFKGFVDEVRVWDGARTAAEISAGYRRHMTMDDAATNRLEVYTHLMGPEADSSRNDNDGLKDLTAELVQLYDFSTLPGAAESDWTAKTPAGFESAVVGQLVGKTDVFDPAVSWWSTSPGRSTVYSDYRVVPWIENTVRHLPTMDGSVIDSFLYSDSLGGYYTTAGEHGLGKFTLYNSAMPYHYYQYYLDRYQRLFCLNRAHEAKPDDTTVRDALYRYRYEIRSYFTATGDLVPMGGAYAKTCPEMWDGNGAADAWSQTGTDTDGDGLPDKWEEDNGLDPNSADDWAAMVSYNGTDIPAWEAYLRDLAKGWQPDGSFKDAYKSTADADGNGLLDWWQNLYALTTGASGDDDGDGLSNYVEYMLSEVFGLKGTGGEWLRFAPDNARSVNPAVSDYFYRMKELYVGEIFTDHDRTKDLWESDYPVKSDMVSPYLYDADVDADGDGWSNYAEFQAGTRPTVLASLGIDAVQMEEHPLPTIEMTLAYHGDQNIANKPIVVKAWSDQTMAAKPDAVWTLGGEGDVSVTQNGGSNVVTGVRYIGMNPQREMLIHLSPGSVVPGSVKFEFKDLAWVLVNMLTQQGYVFDAATAIWEGALIDSMHTGEKTGDIIDQGTKDVLGTIDYITGAVTIDFTKLREWLYIDGDISGSSGEGDWVSIYDLSSSYVRVNWRSKLITGGTTATYYLGRADEPSGANNSLGHVKQGLNTFIAFYDFDGDGMYTPGEPYGFARDVDVGWNYARASIELTETSAITPRYDLTAGGDAGGANGADVANAVTDREQLWELSATDVMVITNGASLAAPPKENVRIRIARFAIDSLNSCLPAQDMAIVYDRTLNLTADGHPSITEADILSDIRNKFDIDWDAGAGSSQPSLSDVYSKYRNTPGIAFTNMIYAVYFGEGPIYAKVDTNEHMLCRMLVRKFDTVRHKPVPVQIPGTLNSSAPTFTWKDSPVDTTYTAFRLRIKNESGAVVWTSDYQLLPPRDEKNIYRWTPPVRVGATVPGGTAELENHAHYSWEISTYNAKFKTDDWTEGGWFYTDVTDGGLDFGTARVAVRYYGPSSVAAGRVRVQAFSTPDFSGDPVAEGYVEPGDTSLSSTDPIKAANASILGLKAGTYYIRAFIDTDGDGRLSTDITVSDGCVWESWGCYCTRDSRTGTIFTPKSVTVGPGYSVSDIIPVYIEDCDVDNDCLPDAWEWLNGNHSLATMNSRSIDRNTGGFAMNSDLVGALEASGQTASGLAVSLAMRSLSTSRVAALLLGVDATGSDDAVDTALNSAGSDATAEPVSVSITAIEVDRDSGTVKITTDSKGSLQGSDVIVSEIYTIPSGAESLTLTCKVLHCDVLGGPWTEIASKEVKIDRTTTDYTFDLGENVDLSSGFFKAKLEK